MRNDDHQETGIGLTNKGTMLQRLKLRHKFNNPHLENLINEREVTNMLVQNNEDIHHREEIIVINDIQNNIIHEVAQTNNQNVENIVIDVYTRLKIVEEQTGIIVTNVENVRTQNVEFQEQIIERLTTVETMTQNVLRSMNEIIEAQQEHHINNLTIIYNQLNNFFRSPTGIITTSLVIFAILYYNRERIRDFFSNNPNNTPIQEPVVQPTHNLTRYSREWYELVGSVATATTTILCTGI